MEHIRQALDKNVRNLILMIPLKVRNHAYFQHIQEKSKSWHEKTVRPQVTHRKRVLRVLTRIRLPTKTKPLGLSLHNSYSPPR